MMLILAAVLTILSPTLLGIGIYKVIGKQSGGFFDLADHVHERRLNPQKVDKKGWSPVYTPADDKTRLEDNYAHYQAIEKGFTL